MKFIESKYKLNGEAPQGTTVCECEVCKTKYAIPTDEIDKYKPVICEECKTVAENTIKSDGGKNQSTDIIDKIGDTSSAADKAMKL